MAKISTTAGAGPTTAQMLMAQLGALPDAQRIMKAGGFGKTYFYRELGTGRFPQPALRLSGRMIRWRFEDVLPWFLDPEAWIAEHAPAEVLEAA